MNFDHKFQDEETGFQMTPMLDVMFLLLIFFVSTSIFYELEHEIGITVPQASEVKDSERSAHEIIINIRSDGEIVVNRQRYDLDGLEQLLKRISGVFSGQAVTIRGDEAARLGSAIDVLNVCAKAKIWNVSFAALQEDVDSGSSQMPTGS